MKERSMVFWVGLILASLAGLELFGIAWLIMVVAYWERPTAIEFWIRSPIIDLGPNTSKVEKLS